jgi:integrase
MTTIRLFLEDNEILIPKQTLKQFQRKQKANRSVTLDTVPANIELKTILSHADLKTKTLILIASSSGMRINEILHLEIDDIDLNSSPAKIYVKGSTAKFGKPRITFISSEAKSSLEEWLRGSNRTDYLETSIKRCNRKMTPITHKDTVNKYIFPFSYQNFAGAWIRLLKKAGLDSRDKTTGYYRLHFHVLRKFTKTRLLNAGCQESIVRLLLGQQDSLSNSYDRYTETELRKSYMQGMKELLIFETSPDLGQINKDLEAKDERIKSQEQRIIQLENETALLKLTMQSLSNQTEIEVLKKRIK